MDLDVLAGKIVDEMHERGHAYGEIRPAHHRTTRPRRAPGLEVLPVLDDNVMLIAGIQWGIPRW